VHDSIASHVPLGSYAIVYGLTHCFSRCCPLKQQQQQQQQQQQRGSQVRQRQPTTRAAVVADGWQDMAAEMIEPEPEPAAEPSIQCAEDGRVGKQKPGQPPPVGQIRKRIPASGKSRHEAQEEALLQAQKAADEESFFEYVIKEEMQPCWPFILGQDLGTALGSAKPAATVRATGHRFGSTIA